MKKLITVFVLSVAILLPSTAVFAAPGYGAEITDCVLWREGMGARLPIHCKATAESNRRLYELEVAMETLRAENAQLRNQIQGVGISNNNALIPAPVYNVTNSFDQGTVARISQLEFKVTALEKKVASQEVTIASLKSSVGSINATLKTAVANIAKLLKKK